MPEMRILDATGDTKIIWDKNNRDEVDNARDTYKKMKDKGYMAYSVKEDGEKKKVVHEFDPEAEKLILTPPLRGG